MPDELIEAARKDHPELMEEFDRLRLWVATLGGDELVSWGGPQVNP